MESVKQLLKSWVDNRLIPGAVADIRIGGRERVQFAYGSYIEEDGATAKSVTLSTVFDAASLTKVTVTLPAVMLLMQEGLLTLDDSIRRYVPEFRHSGITIRHCLMHTSGLPSVLPGFRERYADRDVMDEIMNQELKFAPGEQVLYSDLGYILLGEAIRRMMGQSLDSFASAAIMGPIGMTDSLYRPPAAWKHRIASTEQEGRGYLQGTVHDETGFRLGGVSGNAGLFTTADDLSRYALRWLYPETYPLLTSETVQACLEKPFHGRGLGWIVWDGEGETPSCGAGWSHGSFGHTGYTGTSLWIDPVREIIAVLMTNAVHFGRDNAMRQLRPLFHDAIVEELNGFA